VARIPPYALTSPRLVTAFQNEISRIGAAYLVFCFHNADALIEKSRMWVQ
jgi:hypothetical protein